jgi:ketosteroid isomerase-like protein
MSGKTAAVLVASMVLVSGFATHPLRAAEPAPDAVPDAAAAASIAGLDRLRAAVKDAYKRGDVDALSRYLHPDIVIVFPDGSILKGPQAFKDYYHRMLKGPDHRVVSYSADPVVESRTVHNDVGLSYGYMHDRYVLNTGQSFGLDSRFTVTVLKSPAGPAETGGWQIRSFHSSTDAFDNPVLSMVARTAFLTAGAGGLVVGALLGVLGTLLFRRREPG